VSRFDAAPRVPAAGHLSHENVLVTGQAGRRLPTWAPTPPGIDHAGGTGGGSDSQPRVRTWDNRTGRGNRCPQEGAPGCTRLGGYAATGAGVEPTTGEPRARRKSPYRHRAPGCLGRWNQR
jgi:hypothetical protein